MSEYEMNRWMMDLYILALFGAGMFISVVVMAIAIRLWETRKK